MQRDDLKPKNLVVTSMRVLAKCAYELEGVLKSEVQKNGRYFDIHHFARAR
jgi:RimJ/RimL family protein N-acetyltransferase